TAPLPVSPQVRHPQPTPPPPTRPQGQRAGSRINRGPSLSDLNRKPEEEMQNVVAEATASEMRRGVYSIDDVKDAWYKFMNARPSEHILINTMRASEPVQVEGDSFKITVENRVQTDMMMSMKPTIEVFMRDCLKNDFWTMSVEENQGVGSPRTWNEKEVLDKLIEENESVRKLVSTFKLTL
ncbi:MAG: hypothetical protein K2O43_01435, partial [Muribaculaceae bacterium]|nr:hypothetical protein [Muribaculaceae bacterium]